MGALLYHAFIAPVRGHMPLWKFAAFHLTTGIALAIATVWVIAVIGERYVPWSVRSAVNVGVWLGLWCGAIWLVLGWWQCARGSHPIVKWIARIGLVLGIAFTLLNWPHHHSGTRYKVQEGVNLSNPHRTALGIDCAEGTLAPSTPQEWRKRWEFEPPEAYHGRYVQSVSGHINEQGKGIVIVVYKQIPDDAWPLPVMKVRAGHTVVYEGSCGPETGMTFSVSGTIPEKFRPRT